MTFSAPSVPATRVQQLAALCVVMNRAVELARDRSTLEGEFAQLVEVDVALTGAVLRVARCPIYSGKSGPLTLSRALERMGTKVVGAILDSMPVMDDRRSREDVENGCRHWVHGIAVAAAARWLANQGAYDDAEEAYRAALVHDAARMLAEDPRATESLPALATRLSREWCVGPNVEAVLRHAHARSWTADAGEAYLDHLPPDARRLLTLVSRANGYVSALGFGSLDESRSLKDDDPMVSAVREAVELELAHAGALLGLRPCPPEKFLNLLTNHELSQGSAETSADPAHGLSNVAVRVAGVHQTVLATRGMENVADILTSGLRSLHRGLDFERVLLLEPVPGFPGQLRGRLFFDGTRLELQRGPGGIVIPAEAGGAIQRALETGIPARVDDPDRDAVVLGTMGVDSIAVARIRAGTVNVGAVFADHFFTRAPVTESEVATLGLLSSSLGLVIENMALNAQSKKLRSLAEKDELTGINNRRSLLATLQREVDRARRYGKPLSIVMIDVDHFKMWNDLHGHQVGDLVLKMIAQILSSRSRDIDCHGRYGGEEFIVVLPETPVDRAMLYAERLRVAVEAAGDDLRVQFPDTYLTISLGVTNLGPSGDDVDLMIQRADSALYAAKNQGRNRSCVIPPEKQPPSDDPTPLPPARGILGEL